MVAVTSGYFHPATTSPWNLVRLRQPKKFRVTALNAIAADRNLPMPTQAAEENLPSGVIPNLTHSAVLDIPCGSTLRSCSIFNCPFACRRYVEADAYSLVKYTINSFG